MDFGGTECYELLNCNCQIELTRFEVLGTELCYWDIYCTICVNCGTAYLHLMLITMCEFRENGRRGCRNFFFTGVSVTTALCALRLRAHHLQSQCCGNLVALIFATCAPSFCRATFGFCPPDSCICRRVQFALPLSCQISTHQHFERWIK